MYRILSLINKYNDLPFQITKGEDRVALFFAQKVLEAFEPEVRSIAIPHYLKCFSSGHFFVSYPYLNYCINLAVVTIKLI